MRIGSLFSGVGGIDLGLEMAGLGPVVFQAESDPFCRAVLAKRWPGVPCFEDVRSVGKEALGELAQVDLICGGFPCTDISVAGKGAGLAGARSGLWFEMARIVGELRPRHVLIENVAALLRRGMDQVLFDLHRLGYDARWTTLHASDAGAPHKRARIFIAASRERDAEIGEQGKPAGWLASPDSKPARLPKHGVMAAGVAQEAPPLIGPAGSLAARLWPTPNVPNGGRVNPPGTSPTGRAPDGTKKQIDLAHAVRLWPMPTASTVTEQDMVQSTFAGNDPRRFAYADARLERLWPTPNASDHKGPNPPGRRPECDDDLPTRVLRLWPTPRAGCADGSRVHPGKVSGKSHARQANGGHGDLGEEVARSTWPTPTACDAKASGAAGYPAGTRHSGTTLTDAAQRGLWATPTASDNSDRTTHPAPSHGGGHGRVLAGQVQADPVRVDVITCQCGTSAIGLDSPCPRCSNQVSFPQPDAGPAPIPVDAEDPVIFDLGGKSWPTPTAKKLMAEDYVMQQHAGSDPRRPSYEQAAAEVQAWSTPTAAEADAFEEASKKRLAPAWVECLQGFPVGWTDLGCDEPVLSPGWPAPPGPPHEWEPPRTTVPVRGSSRLARLRALGNAVVPQCAWIAAQMLLEKKP